MKAASEEPSGGDRGPLGMMRISKVVNVALMAAVATVAAVGFIDAARMNDAPSAAECVDDWNARAGKEVQEQVAGEEYRSAKVRGWFTDVSPGCGIGFIPSEGNPMLSCTRPFDASDPQPTRWSCEWRTPWLDETGPSDPATTARIVSRWQLTLGS